MADTLRAGMFREMERKDLFEQARRYAYAYADNVPARNVFPDDEAIRGLDRFSEEIPLHAGDPSAILRQLHEYGSPATVAQIGGRYFGFVNGGVIPVALAARWLSDFWDQNAALHVMSPLAARLEEITERWLTDLLGLPMDVAAGFVSGTSVATFCGLAAARYRILHNHDWDVNRSGLNGAPDVRVLAGRQAHATVLKAIASLGFGLDNVEWIATDDQGRIIPSEIPSLDSSTILILQAGNVASGSFDPFEEICMRARQANAWVHIDGAFGLWVAGSDRLRHLTRGIESADSWSVDGHKTLNTPYDSGIVLCSDREALVQAMQASGSYIAYGEQRDGMLYTPEMSRRARIVELWAALKYLGKEGVDELVFGLHERAVQIERALKAEGFQILNEVVFNQVLVACRDDQTTALTMRHVQASGECWAGGATWGGKAVIRISVCSWATTAQDIERTAASFAAARRRAEKEIDGYWRDSFLRSE